MTFDSLYSEAKIELNQFGLHPIKDVGRIINFLQLHGVEEKALDLAQRIYIQLFQDKGRGTAIQARQSWVTASGNNFEIFIRNLVNESLNNEGIFAVKGDHLRGQPKAKQIVEFLTLKASRRCTQQNTGVWPDSDIVLLTKELKGSFKAFALLNCKTSDHSRNDAVLFWALALRDNNIKYCLVTADLDKRFKKGDDDASSLRRKCEAYLDRVYSTHPETSECSQVIKIDFRIPGGTDSFIEDLRIWRKEVVPNHDTSPISSAVLS